MSARDLTSADIWIVLDRVICEGAVIPMAAAERLSTRQVIARGVMLHLATQRPRASAGLGRAHLINAALVARVEELEDAGVGGLRALDEAQRDLEAQGFDRAARWW